MINSPKTAKAPAKNEAVRECVISQTDKKLNGLKAAPNSVQAYKISLFNLKYHLILHKYQFFTTLIPM